MVPRHCAMTSSEASTRIAVVGTGLIGTSIAMAAARAGNRVAGYDRDRDVLADASTRTALEPNSTLEECVRGARFVFVCTPIPAIADVAGASLSADDRAVVSDVGSVKSNVLDEVEGRVSSSERARFVGGHPMGGSERTGPEGASASLIEGAAWVLTP